MAPILTTVVETNCESCGTRFPAVRTTARYCSDRCRARAARRRKRPALSTAQPNLTIVAALDFEDDPELFLDACRQRLALAMDDPATPGAALVPLSRALRDLL